MKSTIDRRPEIAIVAAHISCVIAAVMGFLPAMDLHADWLQAQAIVNGDDPYAIIDDLATKYSQPRGQDWIHPRTPAALLLQMPYAFFGLKPLTVIVTSINAASVIAAVILAGSIAGVPRRRVMVVAPFALFTIPGLGVLVTGNQAAVLGALVVLTWALADRGDKPLYGVPLGISAAVKLFPGFLILALLVGGRKRTAIGAGFTFLALNSAGLALPGTSLVSSTRSVLGTDRFLHSYPNSSVAAALTRLGMPMTQLIAIILSIVLVVWLVWKHPQWERGLLITAPAMLLASPLTAPSYVVNAAPSIAVAMTNPVILVVLAALWFSPVESLIGYFVAITLAIVTWRAATTEFPGRADPADAIDELKA